MRATFLAAALILTSCAGADSVQRAPGEDLQIVSAETNSADLHAAVDLPAGAYRADPRHTSVHFRIRHEGLSWFTARFDNEEASFTLNPADPGSSQLTASVDPSSVNTGVLNRQGERNFDQAIARALGAGQVSFASTEIDRTGQTTARVRGNLTMNGQTHPAVLEVTFDGAAVDPLRGGATVLGFSAHGVIDRTQWGVTEWSAFAGEEVQIVIEAEFVKV